MVGFFGFLLGWKRSQICDVLGLSVYQMQHCSKFSLFKYDKNCVEKKKTTPIVQSTIVVHLTHRKLFKVNGRSKWSVGLENSDNIINLACPVQRLINRNNCKLGRYIILIHFQGYEWQLTLQRFYWPANKVTSYSQFTKLIYQS